MIFIQNKISSQTNSTDEHVIPGGGGHRSGGGVGAGFGACHVGDGGDTADKETSTLSQTNSCNIGGTWLFTTDTNLLLLLDTAGGGHFWQGLPSLARESFPHSRKGNRKG